MIVPRRSSHRGPRSALFGVGIALLSLGCSGVQDLGHDEADPVERAPTPTARTCSDGFGAQWSCEGEAVARDFACPLGRPIDGSDCTGDDRAPCIYLDGNEPSPDVDVPGFELPPRSERRTSLCLCGRDQRWSCLAGVSFRTLAAQVVDGDACVDPVEVKRPCAGGECAAWCGGASCDLVCRCAGGRYRCAR